MFHMTGLGLLSISGLQAAYLNVLTNKSTTSCISNEKYTGKSLLN